MRELKIRHQSAIAALAAGLTLTLAGCGTMASNVGDASSAVPTANATPAATGVRHGTGTTTANSPNASKAAFVSTPTYASDDGFDISVSPDGQAFTIRFSDIEAVVGAAGTTPTPIDTRTFSLILPVKGGDDGVDISFWVSGYAFVNEGASAYVAFSVNGDSRFERLRPGADNDFVYTLKLQGARVSECRLSVFLYAERTSNDPGGAAHLTVSTIDAEITPQVG